MSTHGVCITLSKIIEKIAVKTYRELSFILPFIEITMIKNNENENTFNKKLSRKSKKKHKIVSRSHLIISILSYKNS
jgi:hypothetical protein